jgi:hypothetical protein
MAVGSETTLLLQSCFQQGLPRRGEMQNLPPRSPGLVLSNESSGMRSLFSCSSDSRCHSLWCLKLHLSLSCFVNTGQSRLVPLDRQGVLGKWFCGSDPPRVVRTVPGFFSFSSVSPFSFSPLFFFSSLPPLFSIFYNLQEDPGI